MKLIDVVLFFLDMKIVPMSLNMEQKSFRADHPFVFAIRSKTAVYFAGHVAKF